MSRGYFSAKKHRDLGKFTGTLVPIIGRKNENFLESVEVHGKETFSSANLIGPGVHGIRFKGKAFGCGEEKELSSYLFHDAMMESEERAGMGTRVLMARKALEGKRTDIGGLGRTYFKWLNIDVTKTGRIKSVKTRTEEVEAMMHQAWFFWIISTMKMSPAEMLRT